MCFQCGDNGLFGPEMPRNLYDPIPEGVTLNRMKPEVERLVIQAETVGYLNSDNRWLRQKNLELADENQQIDGQLAETQRKLNYTRRDLEEVVKERDSALRRIPKKPKVTKKGKK